MPIKITEIQKDVRPLSSLKEWVDNPRFATPEALKRLLGQIGMTGDELYKPLLILADGTVIGGNQRLKVMRQMGIKEAWVFQIDAGKDLTREDVVTIAQDDNGRAGAYVEESLRAQVILADWEKDVRDLLHADTSLPVDMRAFLDSKAKDIAGDTRSEDTDKNKEKLDKYENGDQKQVVLFFMENERQRIEMLFDGVKSAYEVESNADALLAICLDYAANHAK